MSPENVVQTFVFVIGQRKQAFVNAQADRERIKAQLEAGEVPEGPRVKFIVDTANEIIRVLIRRAKEFNDRNRNDRITIHDLYDAINTALNRIKEQSK